jgi:hypothetical protein
VNVVNLYPGHFAISGKFERFGGNIVDIVIRKLDTVETSAPSGPDGN